MSLSGDFDWFLSADLSAFEGEWVVIRDKRVVAHSKKLKDVIKVKGWKHFVQKGARSKGAVK